MRERIGIYDLLQEPARQTIRRLLILSLGVAVANLGVSLFLLTSLGSDPYNVLVEGVCRTLSRLLPGITHGLVHGAMNFLIILLLLLFSPQHIKLGTLVCLVIGGPLIDMWLNLLGGSPIPILPIEQRLVVVLLSCPITAIGVSIVIASKAGTGPNDLVAVAISDGLGKQFYIVRLLTDAAFMLTGCILGGTAGPGTLAAVFLMGPIIGKLLPYQHRWIKRWVEGQG